MAAGQQARHVIVWQRLPSLTRAQCDRRTKAMPAWAGSGRHHCHSCGGRCGPQQRAMDAALRQRQLRSEFDHRARVHPARCGPQQPHRLRPQLHSRVSHRDNLHALGRVWCPQHRRRRLPPCAPASHTPCILSLLSPEPVILTTVYSKGATSRLHLVPLHALA